MEGRREKLVGRGNNCEDVRPPWCCCCSRCCGTTSGGGCGKARVAERDEATTVEMGGRVVPVAGRLLDPVPGRLREIGEWSGISGRLKLNGVDEGARKDWPGYWALSRRRGGTRKDWPVDVVLFAVVVDDVADGWSRKEWVLLVLFVRSTLEDDAQWVVLG